LSDPSPSVHVTSTGPSTLGASARTLSKSDFKLARTCDAKLYFRENGYPDNRDGKGTGAMRAYQEMMYGLSKSDPEARMGWAALLKQYCRLDTLSMVLILEHWRRVA
jgi:hypothetical protein